MDDLEKIRTARRSAIFYATFPSAVAIGFGLDNGSCAPIGTIILGIPILFALFLPAADIVCFAVARALAHPATPTACLP